MRCPSCGTSSNGSSSCNECGHNLVDLMTSEYEPSHADAEEASDSQLIASSDSLNKTHHSRLIEFPGVARHSMPGWRKEVAERVREAQERKAREAAAEAELTLTETDRPTPQLELLPQAELPPINPLVAAALKRIERAYVDPQPARARSRRQSRMAAVAYATESAFPVMAAQQLEPPMTTSPTLLDSSTEELEPAPLIEEPAPEIEKTHNLTVVPPATPPAAPAEVTVSAEIKRPRRIISDDPNSPALNYLDSVTTAIHPEDVTNRAPLWIRSFAGILDLMVVAALFAPFVLAFDLMRPGWLQVEIIAVTAATVLVLSFLYSTLSTAFTGRTLGMKLFGLRVVDERTGLIPTGSQSAGRALLFEVALLTAGIFLAYALVDPDRRTAHDKFTRTAVIKS